MEQVTTGTSIIARENTSQGLLYAEVVRVTEKGFLVINMNNETVVCEKVVGPQGELASICFGPVAMTVEEVYNT